MSTDDQEREESRRNFLRYTTREQRSRDLYHHIDPGFVNHRLCFNAIGQAGLALFEAKARHGTDHFERLANDHLLTNILLRVLRARHAPCLGEEIRQPQVGVVFASTEDVLGNPGFYELARPTNRIRFSFQHRYRVVLEYDRKKVVSDTLSSELHGGRIISIAGVIRSIEGRTATVAPLVMGGPWLEHPLNADAGIDPGALMFMGQDFFELAVSDIDEFRLIGDVSTDVDVTEWQSYMSKTPEDVIKLKLTAILKDDAQKDWGGEECDHFSAHVHVAGRRVNAAFAFKGPAKFKPMTPAMLGKNGDQIYRMASTPANLLVLQHCHDVGTAVRETLRRFAVSPHNPRHFCVIDGRDTFRLLKAYDRL